ncbi:N-acetyl-alpha-D-glucosaminyl L-malate synthase BshA [Rubricoccus marinus]|uniref:N-acetyl-alpha-D-glucosaminyl L-malate synthase BshA n=1 Tax=Rubricoccus marinus TaxID=716817 RepID=A0A259TYX1_9BACT|nr:N-acetyl-alpha-D-glucosaminyl L-malate synthase BshA [Rubricoccus marinus]OZC02886.1 N-acetyl-alpha-D-glucosaminyl L-malate synthase BshA [Rubricoccus marinus]
MTIGITCYPTFGGSGVVATELGKALAARGHTVHFIAYALPLRLEHVAENLYFHEVRVNTYPLFEYPPYALALASKMIDVVKHEGLDLLHVHYAIPHATSAVLARQILESSGHDVPVVTTLHGTDITIVGKDPSFKPVVEHAIDASDGVTAVSDWLRRETCSSFDISQEIEVIPNFIDTERFQRHPKDHFKRAIAPDGEKLLVHVSNFRKVKRATDVVEVFSRLHESGVWPEGHPKHGQPGGVKLLMVGDGPDRAASEVRAREAGVWNDVRFIGKQEPVEEILSIADLFLMPSASETFGLAALEAMACGVPVVSSDIGGLPELNLDGVTGFLRPLADVDGMTEASRRILTDPELHARMARAARERAVSEFELDQIVPQYEAHYQRVMDARTVTA